MKEKKNNKPEKKNNNTPEYYHNGKLYIELIFLKCYNNKGVNKSEIMTELNRIFSTPDLWVSDKYGGTGVYIKIEIPEEDLEKLGYTTLNDGLGDKCVVLEGEGILIPPEYFFSSGGLCLW